MNIKIKPIENQTFKSFEVELQDIGWKKRCELNDEMIKATSNGSNPSFSWWGGIVLKYTDLKESELNKYSTDEIIGIAHAIFEAANKKK